MSNSSSAPREIVLPVRVRMPIYESGPDVIPVKPMLPLLYGFLYWHSNDQGRASQIGVLAMLTFFVTILFLFARHHGLRLREGGAFVFSDRSGRSHTVTRDKVCGWAKLEGEQYVFLDGSQTVLAVIEQGGYEKFDRFITWHARWYRGLPQVPQSPAWQWPDDNKAALAALGGLRRPSAAFKWVVPLLLGLIAFVLYQQLK
jgi:hypothetical protein